ncbi:MAG: TonB-dependent receptor [Saprospirales bacterium]|nr:TonB-dependent receptor [Saprospirales bacterium]MBK8921092.1 TonB-dependent receptor [Saprospirales bacterium]
MPEPVLRLSLPRALSGLAIWWITAFGPAGASAQTSFSGQIKAPDGTPVEFATVLLYLDTGIVARAVSDDGGHFWLNWPWQAGDNNRLRIIRLGFRSLDMPLAPGADGRPAGPTAIRLEPDEALTLNEATIVARAPVLERKADRLVFYVENSLFASGGTAWDALRGTPGLSSSEQGNISVNGKGVGILVNDKLVQLSGEQLLGYLNALKSDDIRRIEVIANPPARYDAEGLNGLINIVLKKNPQLGWNGTVRAGYQQNTYAKYNIGTTLNYRQKQFNAYSSVLLNYGEYFMREKLWQRFADSAGEVVFYDQTLRRPRTQAGESLRAGLDYFIGPKVTAGVLYTGNFGWRRPDDNTATVISPDRIEVDSTLFTANRSDQQSNNNALNANLNITLDSLASYLNIDADWLKFHSTNRLNSQTGGSAFPKDPASSLTAFRNDTRQTIRINTVKADWLQHIGQGLTLEAGVKYNYSRTDNDFLAENWNRATQRFEYDPVNSNRLVYEEAITACYASIAGTASRLEYKFGLRGEHTGVEIYSVTQNKRNKQDYFKLFPTAYLLYAFNAENSIGVDVGRRIQRPAFWELNPFRIYLTPFSYSEGNPLLQPAFTYEAALNATLKGVHNLTIYAGITDDLFTQFPVQDNASRSIRYTRGNLTEQRYAGLAYQTSTTLTKWWTLTSNLDVSREQQRSRFAQLEADYTRTVANVYFVHALKIAPKRGISGEITLHYASPSVRGFYHLRATAHLAAGLKAKCFRDQADVSLYAFDILRTTTARSDVELQDQRSYSEQFFDMQGIRLNFSWKFGRNSVPKNRERQTGNTDEARRIGG